MTLTQSELVQAMQDERIPIHRHFRTEGAFYQKAPHAADGLVVVAEIDKMMLLEKLRTMFPNVKASTPVPEIVKLLKKRQYKEQECANGFETTLMKMRATLSVCLPTCLPASLPASADNESAKFRKFAQQLGEEDAAYHLACQPLLNGVKDAEDAGMDGGQEEEGEETPEMTCEDEEMLLRAKDGTQNFPVAVAYHLSAAKRQEFSMCQTLKAVGLAEETGRCVQVNWWEQDLAIMVNEVVGICGGRNVRIELTEYKKDVDAPGYPVMTTFTSKTIELLTMLHLGGVKVSLDDCNWIQPNHPCNFEFALEVAPLLDQLKLDIKACAQVYNTLPTVPFAEKFAPLEPDEIIRAQKATALTQFVAEMRRRNDKIGLVIELSVCSPTLASKFPFNVFEDRWVLVQGGLTNNWAMRV